MVDTNKLKGKIVECGLTQDKVAEMLGMSRRTFYSHMKKGSFATDDVMKLKKILALNDPAIMRIFFAKIVS